MSTRPVPIRLNRPEFQEYAHARARDYAFLRWLRLFSAPQLDVPLKSDFLRCRSLGQRGSTILNSNWQVSTQSRNVKDGKQTDISREPEQVKAFRDMSTPDRMKLRTPMSLQSRCDFLEGIELVQSAIARGRQ